MHVSIIDCRFHKEYQLFFSPYAETQALARQTRLLLSSLRAMANTKFIQLG